MEICLFYTFTNELARDTNEVVCFTTKFWGKKTFCRWCKAVEQVNPSRAVKIKFLSFKSKKLLSEERQHDSNTDH